MSKVALGDACSQTSMCNTTGAECRRGFCICPPDYYYIDNQCSAVCSSSSSSSSSNSSNLALSEIFYIVLQ